MTKPYATARILRTPSFRNPASTLLPLCATACALALTTAPAHAAPGTGEEVYGATVEAKEIEVETRYGQLTGGPQGGEDNARLEVSYGVTSDLSLALTGEFERDAGQSRKARALGLEAVYHFAHIGAWDFAGYGELEKGLSGNANSVETKLLAQRRSGLWDFRFNLIGEKPLRQTDPMVFSYATSIDRSVARNLRLGVTAFGDLGTVHTLLPSAEHYVGPVTKWRIPMADADGDDDNGIIIEAGYLFAAGATTRQTTGQWRLNVELEM